MKNIPYEDFGGTGDIIHFAHANGYPPKAYSQLLTYLTSHHRVISMRMRPFWPGSDPGGIKNWQPLAKDLSDFIKENNLTKVVGIGHSVGATTTLRMALTEPQHFTALILIDPVIFQTWMILLWNFVYILRIAEIIHPLVRNTLRRRNNFPDKNTMFLNYRSKPIFRYIDDTNLHHYVEALATQNPDGSLGLCYPPQWEARIYATGILADREIWKNISNIELPILIIRGEFSNTFWTSTARMIKNKLPSATIVTIPGTTHLVPLEKPGLVYNHINQVLENHS